jgi:hypothetical protein
MILDKLFVLYTVHNSLHSFALYIFVVSLVALAAILETYMMPANNRYVDALSHPLLIPVDF